MNPMGHRYRCTSCSSEVIVTKPGEGAMGCCDRLMENLTQAELDSLERGDQANRRP